MGAAGDMLTAALLELLPDREAFLQKLQALGIPGVTFAAEKSTKCDVVGTHMSVKVFGEEEGHHDHHHEHEHHHHHSGMEDIAHVLSHLSLPEQVKKNVLAVYDLIAQAESHVHGVPVPQIHFHEVGSLDAVADVTAVCMLMDELHPDKIVASPIHVGTGTVRCAHGILPVPAPATAYILRDVPVYGGAVQGELCTPTGAALLKYFVTEFAPMPLMKVERIGYGMGNKDFPQANCVRAMLGQMDDAGEEILELSCNVDDMTGETVGFAMEQLLQSGACDVYTVPVGMKKSRPGTMICVMCHAKDRQAMIEAMFRHTTTLGIREQRCSRHVLNREIRQVETPLGTVRRKDSFGYGVSRSKYERIWQRSPESGI